MAGPAQRLQPGPFPRAAADGPGEGQREPAAERRERICSLFAQFRRRESVSPGGFSAAAAGGGEEKLQDTQPTTAASRSRAGEEKRVRALQLRAAGSSCAALCFPPPAHWSDKNTAGAAGALRPDSTLTGPAPFLLTTPHRPRQGPRLFPARERNTHRTAH